MLEIRWVIFKKFLFFFFDNLLTSLGLHFLHFSLKINFSYFVFFYIYFNYVFYFALNVCVHSYIMCSEIAHWINYLFLKYKKNYATVLLCICICMYMLYIYILIPCRVNIYSMLRLCRLTKQIEGKNKSKVRWMHIVVCLYRQNEWKITIKLVSLLLSY